MSEKRIDPEDGQAYTWEEFFSYYKKKYNKKVCEDYFYGLKIKKEPKAKGKGKGKGKSEPEPKAKAKAKAKGKAKAAPVKEPKVTAKIKKLKAREILDSRGNPTVEVDLITDKGVFRAAVPSGASTGIYEAVELRDKDADRFLGKGCLKAVENVNKILAPKLRGKDAMDQAKLDKLMYETLDGSQNEWGYNKGKLGANAILAVSMAMARASAAAKDMPLYARLAELAGTNTKKYVLPVPSFNVINGGSHAGNALSCQEFMVLPIGASTFKEAMQIGAEVYHNLAKVLKKKYGQDAVNVGDEGGFAPPVTENDEALQVLMQAIEASGHKDKIKIGTDVAASEFCKDGKYDLYWKTKDAGKKMLSSKELADYYQKWVDKYPMISIEDPFDQDDWDGYRAMTKDIGKDVQIVGDDLLVTNPKRIGKAQEGDDMACNALLLKVNQIGTVTEAIDAFKLSRSKGWGVMMSHRSGETEDTFIADFAVGLGTGQIKTGAPCRSERLAKYNQIMRIEEELGSKAIFAGLNFRNPQKRTTKVVMVRHGESTWNALNLFTGWQDVELSETGKKEAAAAGETLKEGKWRFDSVHTSQLGRAQNTLNAIKEALGGKGGGGFRSIQKTWRLNERHYGNLTGLDKAETAAKFGDEQVKIWRRSFDVPPPAIEESNKYYEAIQKDDKYAKIPKEEMPVGESLELTIKRTMPYWNDKIVPQIKKGRTVLIVAHGNSLRGIVKHLDKMSDSAIMELNLPTGIPFVYELDSDTLAVEKSMEFLGDEETVKKAMESVAAQGKAKK